MTHTNIFRYHFRMIVLFCISMFACTDLTDVENDVKELQKTVNDLQEAVSALQLAYQNGKVIESVQPLNDNSETGWDITFSDGSSIRLENGKDGENGENGITPYLMIDVEGYWCVSYDGGHTFDKISDKNGNFFLSEGQEGISIRVVINENGYYAYETYYASTPDVTLSTIVTPYTSDTSHIISSIEKNEKNGLITLVMADNTSFTFNLDITYPTGIVLLTNNLSVGKNSVSVFEFRVNPSNAVFSLDVKDDHPQLELDKIDINTRTDAPSYVTPPTNYKLIKVEHSLNEKGEIKVGQYKAYIQDLGIASDYTEEVILVLSTKDGTGNSIQLSSSLLHISSGGGGNSFLSFGVSSSVVGMFDALGISGKDVSVCVPYGTDISNLVATFNTNGDKVFVDDVEQISGVTVNDFSTPIVYRIISKQNVTQEYKVTIYSFDLPVIYVTTPQQTPILSKDDWVEDGNIRIWMTNGIIGDLGGTSVKGRGNSTWSFPKKPYAIKLDKKAEVLGMPKHKRWVLLANWIDRTLMRNHIAFTIAKNTESLGWTPRGEFVELILNGKHLGNYYLCEQIKIDKSRVNIAEMESTDIDGDAITGGYLLEMDINYDEVNKFHTDIRNLPVNIKEPDEDVLVDKQFNYIQNYINQVERAIYADNFSIDGHSYTEYIDVNSFIDWWLVHELTHNGEPGWPKSSYMHKDKNDKLVAGPVWDFDYWTFVPEERFCMKHGIWYSRLFEDPYFVTLVKQKWNSSQPVFESIVSEIDNTALKIKNSEKANFKMWPLTDNINEDAEMTFEEAVNHMKKTYLNRISWMDEAINDL